MHRLQKIGIYQGIAVTLVFTFVITMLPFINLSAFASTDENTLSNEYFNVKIGDYGEINSLKLAKDEFDTNYVLNGDNAPTQGESLEHQWMGELMFNTKRDGENDWTQSMTSASLKESKAREIKRDGNKITITYKNEESDRGIKDFELVESYELIDNHLKWSIKLVNTDPDKAITFGDIGLPMPFNEYFTPQYDNEMLYETRVIYHSFVGQDSSYIYASRPSGQGRFLLFSPEVSTGAKLEYQDHWRVDNGHADSVWAQDQGGWANGLNVFYIHSNAIKETGSSYLPNTELTLNGGESKEYSFDFTPVQNEEKMKSELYNDGVIDAVAVPGMAFSKDMDAKFYLHTKYDYESSDTKNNITNLEVKCSHETHLYEGLNNSVSNKQSCTKNENTSILYEKTEEINNEKYHVFNLKLSDLGANYVIVHYLDELGNEKTTTLQFYVMDKAEDALNLHANFVTNKTQVDAPGKIQDRIFDDWLMDSKDVRGIYNGYMGWGDDWGFTHGEYLAEKNVYLPVKNQIEAVDNYLDTAIWNGLMREHHEDYKVNDWLDEEPNSTGQGVSRGYAYPHVYNTYFSMYKVASKYPNITTYKEDKETYLLRAYHIMKALYGDNISYNWDTGLMGESTTPDIIDALEKEGYYKEAQDLKEIMSKKYVKFSEQKYPYGSEYSYDNTGEEAVYTLAKLQNNKDMMKKIDEKTRADRGIQPIWYHYANPTTICGENWWNFQYSASLIGYCMDDWLRIEDNGMNSDERALAARVNYAAKLANLTSINSGQIDSDSENIGTVAWTYQSELGNNGAQGTGGGSIHNGWRQMSGEADTGLFGAMHILSSDVSKDPIFGLYGYGCKVTDNNDSYEVIPQDGLYTRLNFIDEKLFINLDRDQYSKAIVSKSNDSIELSMKNIEKTAHNTEIKLTGLSSGNYEVLVNGNVVNGFIAKGNNVNVTIPMNEAEIQDVVIKKGDSGDFENLTVEAGTDKTVEVSDTTKLDGFIVSGDKSDTTLKCNWTLESKPDGSLPKIENPDKLISNVSFDKEGEYVFKLTASNSTSSSSSDTVKVIVNTDSEIPEILALYNFDNVNSNKINREEYRKLKSDDSEGKGYSALNVSNPAYESGKEGKALSLSGSYCGYVKLPKEITKKVDESTISADINLKSNQGSDARIFDFKDNTGNTCYTSITNGNVISMGITDATTKDVKEISSNINIGIGYWKNVTMTISKDEQYNNYKATLYIDGVNSGEINNCIRLSDLGEVQSNFIGRGENKSGTFFNGLIDNFIIKSKAMTSEEISANYGITEGSSPVSGTCPDIITKIKKAPSLPSQIKVLYSNGIYKMENITWDAVSEESYKKTGTFTVLGKVESLSEKVKVNVHVVKGDEDNLSSIAKVSAIINSTDDLGGITGLNDGVDPENSADTSHGVWHNWHGEQGGIAWVQYDFDDSVILTECDAYYFKDGSGNFKPSTVEYEYKNQNGEWQKFDNVSGLGTQLNTYNKTTFNPVVATGIRMNMKPATVGCGVIEWQVYGYTNADIVNKKKLKEAISYGNIVNKDLIESGYSDLKEATEEAEVLVSDLSVTQENVDLACEKVLNAIDNLLPKDGNLAYEAKSQTSFVSSWENLEAINDGKEGTNSRAVGIPHYGSWGNRSSYETVTYTWPKDKKISSSEIYFWNDGGGILTPLSYKYEYQDDDGNWKEVNNLDNDSVELDKYNISIFDSIKTKAFRIILKKVKEDENGVGIVEWKVKEDNSTIEIPENPVTTPSAVTPGKEENDDNIGDIVMPETTGAAVTVDKSKLEKEYNNHKDDSKGNYTTSSWDKFISALKKSLKVLKDSNATQSDVDDALAGLKLSVDDRKRKKSSHKSKKNKTQVEEVVQDNYDNLNKSYKTLIENFAKIKNISIISIQNIKINDSENITCANTSANGNKEKILIADFTGVVNLECNKDIKVYKYIEKINSYKIVPIKQTLLNNISFLASKGDIYILSAQLTNKLIVQDGWNNIDGYWYYINPEGNLLYGWYKENGTWYHLSNDGIMNKGWFKDIDEKWYYLKEDGTMAYNEYIAGYYLSGSGDWIK